MAAIAAAGFDAVKKITRYFLPFLLAGQRIILYLYFTTRSAASSAFDMPAETNSAFLTMALYASLVFLFSIFQVSALQLICRDTRNLLSMAFSDYTPAIFWIFPARRFGAYNAFYYNQLNPFISASSLTDSIPIVMVILRCSFISMFSLYLFLHALLDPNNKQKKSS
jgi:hypothetical protein